MIRRLASAFVLAAALAGCGAGATAARGPAGPAGVASAGPAAAVSSINGLTLELLRRLPDSGNVVFSPYSIQSALAMVDQGAAGETETQIDHVLGASSPSALAASEPALRSALQSATSGPGGPRLNVANGLWVRTGLSLAQPFQSTLSRDFGAAPQQVEFADPAAAAARINDWVARRTAGLIRGLMPPGSIPPSTALALANAIYLKARWVKPFNRSLTAPRRFFTAPGHTVTAQFMTEAPTSFSYGAGTGYRAIELPYRNSELSMLLVMPSSPTLAGFDSRLTLSKLATIERSLRTRQVELAMPRFHLAAHTELNGVLGVLGMPIAFTQRADFSRIGPAQLRLGTVEHGADLKVDEAGTVAAAATAITVVPTVAFGGPTVQLVLNHPFLALIREDRTGAILFAATVSDPEAP